MKYICYFFFFFIICYLFHQLIYILLSAICCHQSTVGWWVSANMEKNCHRRKNRRIVKNKKREPLDHWSRRWRFLFLFFSSPWSRLWRFVIWLSSVFVSLRTLCTASSSQQWTELFTLLCLSVCTVLLSKYVSVKKYVGQTTKVKFLLNCLNFPFLEIWRSLKYLFATKR